MPLSYTKKQMSEMIEYTLWFMGGKEGEPKDFNNKYSKDYIFYEGRMMKWEVFENLFWEECWRSIIKLWEMKEAGND